MRYYHLQAIIFTPLSARAFFSSSTSFQLANFSGKHIHRQAIIRSSNSGSSTRRSMSSASSNQEGGDADKNLVVDPFCFRQFAEKEGSKGYAGAVFDVSIDKFEEIVNSRYDPSNLKDGYAPFCKHIFLANDFSNARVNVLPIVKDNEHALRTKYEARNDKELPVLTRYFDREILLKDGKEESDVFPVAKYIDLILYSREQIEKENAAMGKEGDGGEEKKEKAPWGIVSIKAQDVDHELPMTPITAMRNALGKDQGGSGVDLVRESYMEAYEYWNGHANVL